MMRRRILVSVSFCWIVTFSGPSVAGMDLDMQRELLELRRGKVPELRIAFAKYRVAVFAYEDPNNTGLGNAISSIIGSEMLYHGRIRSIGVLRYGDQELSATSATGRYFDKVDALTRSQQVQLAIWGVIRVSADQMVIDTYAQIPIETLVNDFQWRLSVEGNNLLATLRPDRILVQSVRLPLTSRTALVAAAKATHDLRKKPYEGADIIQELPQNTAYSVRQRQGGWVQVLLANGATGWLKIDNICTAECQAIRVAAEFASCLLRYIEDGIVSTPDVSSLTQDSRTVLAQLQILAAVKHGYPISGISSSFKHDTRFVNFRALATIASAGASSTSTFPDIASDLAIALQQNPRDGEALHNAAILFSLIGDLKRSKLAQELLKNTDMPQRTTPLVVKDKPAPVTELNPDEVTTEPVTTTNSNKPVIDELKRFLASVGNGHRSLARDCLLFPRSGRTRVYSPGVGSQEVDRPSLIDDCNGLFAYDQGADILFNSGEKLLLRAECVPQCGVFVSGIGALLRRIQKTVYGCTDRHSFYGDPFEQLTKCLLVPRGDVFQVASIEKFLLGKTAPEVRRDVDPFKSIRILESIVWPLLDNDPKNLKPGRRYHFYPYRLGYWFGHPDSDRPIEFFMVFEAESKRLEENLQKIRTDSTRSVIIKKLDEVILLYDNGLYFEMAILLKELGPKT